MVQNSQIARKNAFALNVRTYIWPDKQVWYVHVCFGYVYFQQQKILLNRSMYQSYMSLVSVIFF